MRAFYSDQFVLPLPEGHRFPMAKYRLLRERLAQEVPEIEMLAAQPASDGELALVHTPQYIESVVQGSLSPQAQRDIGEGLAANLAGGTHHAYADHGSGFCVFNDAAVATRLMQAEWGRRYVRPLKVAIVDLDVHQGNGTAHIFANDPHVFTLSLHGARNFPFAKETSDLDVELPDGCDDDAYLEALDHALSTLASRFDPDLVIYLAGADPHEGDRLGRLKLSFDGLEARDRRVFDWAFNRRLPLAFAMAGGYGQHIADTVQVQVNTYRVAQAYWRRWQNRAQ